MGTNRQALGVLRRVPLLITVLALLLSATSAAQTLTASPGDAPPPGELSSSIQALLAPGSIKVQSGSTTLEFWWVKSLSPAGEGWTGVPEGTLVGAVRIAEPYPDIRGRRMKPGVYTLRFALQPMNGDHLGVSPHREFLLVVPAASDTTVAPLGYQGTVDLSKQATGSSHPAAWSLDPPDAAGEPLRSVTNDEGHHAIVFRAGSLSFGLILIGKIEA